MTEQQLIGLIEGRMPFPAPVSLDSNVFDELGFDSILLLDLILVIEQESGCQFIEEDLKMENLATPRKLLGLVALRGGVA